MKRIATDGDEQQLLTAEHRGYRWRAGQRKQVKVRAHKRDRQESRHALRSGQEG